MKQPPVVYIQLDIYMEIITRIYTSCMWQSRVEIEHYSIVYFDHITPFEALKHSTSVMGGAHTRS